MNNLPCSDEDNEVTRTLGHCLEKLLKMIWGADLQCGRYSWSNVRVQLPINSPATCFDHSQSTVTHRGGRPPVGNCIKYETDLNANCTKSKNRKKKLHLPGLPLSIDKGEFAKGKEVEPNLLPLTKGEKNARVAKNKDCRSRPFSNWLHFSLNNLLQSFSYLGGIDLKGGKGGECAYSSVRREKW